MMNSFISYRVKVDGEAAQLIVFATTKQLRKLYTS